MHLKMFEVINGAAERDDQLQKVQTEFQFGIAERDWDQIGAHEIHEFVEQCSKTLSTGKSFCVNLIAHLAHGCAHSNPAGS